MTTTPPIVTLDEVKQHLKLEVDDTSQDQLLPIYVAGAIGSIDGPSGWLGRALTPQTITRTFPCSGRISLPYPPLLEVQTVETRSYGGAWATLDPTSYTVDENRVCGISSGQECRVTWQAGYDGTPGHELPAPIKVAILMMVADLHSNRTTVETGVRAAAVAIPSSMAVSALLGPFRVWSL